MGREILVVDDVYKTYPGGVRALHGVSLSIRKGEVVGLVGSNGSGKTTLIKVSLGLLSRDKGRVELNGVDPFKDPRARENVGIVFERPTLPSGIPVKRLLEIAAKIYGAPRDAVDEAIELAGLRGHEHKSFPQLSAGLKQRAAIAHALIAQPDFIVADEPTSNLDPLERVRVIELLSRLNREKGVTLLISSHIIYEIMRVAVRVVVVSKGRVVRDGRIDEILGSNVKARIRATKPSLVAEVLRRRGFKTKILGATVYASLDGRKEALMEALLEAEKLGAYIVSFDVAEPSIEEVLSLD